jgi:hypothetical protein
MRQPGALIALGLALSLATQARAQLTAHPPTDLSGLTLEDQFQRAQSVSAHRGDVLVILYGDRASADANKYLGEQLHVAFHPTARGQPAAQARAAPVTPVPGAGRSPDVHVVPAASLGTVPTLLRGLIRGQFRSGSPEVAVWLDWQDVLKRDFGLAAGVPNVVVFDTQGRLRYTFAGTVDQPMFNQLTAAIEGLRREAPPAR